MNLNSNKNDTCQLKSCTFLSLFLLSSNIFMNFNDKSCFYLYYSHRSLLLRSTNKNLFESLLPLLFTCERYGFCIMLFVVKNMRVRISFHTFIYCDKFLLLFERIFNNNDDVVTYFYPLKQMRRYMNDEYGRKRQKHKKIMKSRDKTIFQGR